MEKEIIFVTHNTGKIKSAEKWSDLWYIFKPEGFNKTLAEMGMKKKEKIEEKLMGQYKQCRNLQNGMKISNQPYKLQFCNLRDL